MNCSLTFLDTATARIKKCENQHRRKTSDLITRAAKCTEVRGGILEYLLNLLFYH
jgi:hypothetical protein